MKYYYKKNDIQIYEKPSFTYMCALQTLEKPLTEKCIKHQMK